MTNPQWAEDFTRTVVNLLREREGRGEILVERVELSDDDFSTLYTVLRSTVDDRRYGRRVHLDHFRSLFAPDAPGGVAEAWFQAIFPPGPWQPQHVHDGVSWLNGDMPD